MLDPWFIRRQLVRDEERHFSMEITVILFLLKQPIAFDKKGNSVVVVGDIIIQCGKGVII